MTVINTKKAGKPASSFIKYYEIKSNPYQAYLIIILQLLLVLCIFRLIGNFVIFIIRIKSGTTITNRQWEVTTDKKK